METQLIIDKFILKNNVSAEYINDFLNRRSDNGSKRTILDLLCKCGEPKKVNIKTGYVSSYCGNSACWMHYGKPRPDHSLIMKRLAKNTDKLVGLFKSGKLHNAEINSDLFKRKILENKGIQIFDLNKQYSEYQALKAINNKPKSYETKLKMVPDNLKNVLYQKYGNIPLTKEYFLSLDIPDRDKLFFDIHGVLTKFYDSKIRKVRGTKFKRKLVKNLLYNTKVTAIICKSELEHKWIKYFEKNKIYWEYEPFTILGKLRGTYTPDFLINHNNELIVLEVKGTLYGYPKDYIENKIEACKEYCETKNLKFLFKLNTKVEL